MKIVYIAIGLLTGFHTAAVAMENNTDQKKQEYFLSKKQETLKQMDAKIALLQQARECINAAKDYDELKKCHETQEAVMRKMQKEMELKQIEGQQQKLEERKRQLQQEKEKEPQKETK